MRVLHVKGVFALERSSDLDDRPKRHRWRWHGRNGCSSDSCAACKAGLPQSYWWTESAQHVAALVTAALRDGLQVEIDPLVLVDQIARHADPAYGAHICPGRTCTREIGAGTLYCRACWFKLTREEQREVWDEWVRWQRGQSTRADYLGCVQRTNVIVGARQRRPEEA